MVAQDRLGQTRTTRGDSDGNGGTDGDMHTEPQAGRQTWMTAADKGQSRTKDRCRCRQTGLDRLGDGGQAQTDLDDKRGLGRRRQHR